VKDGARQECKWSEEEMIAGKREKRCVIPPQGLFRASRFSGVASVSIRRRKGDSNGREASGA